MSDDHGRGAEDVWVSRLRTASTPERQAMLRAFAHNYYYFSLHQVRAFSGIFRVIPFHEREVLCQLADVLHEELGRLNPRRVHSRLLEPFLLAVGYQPSPTADLRPCRGVRAYVERLDDAFGSEILGRALAAYVFLEESAVAAYPLLRDVFVAVDLPHDALGFFDLHAEVEKTHANVARDLLQTLGLTREDPTVAAELSCLRGLWGDFWRDILAEGTPA